MTDTDYVSYPLALALKKAGFDYPCYFYYTRKDSPDDHVYSTTSEEAPIDYNRSVYAGCSMPTLAQAQKWLREEWGIHINVCIYSDYSTDADGKVCDRWDFWGFDLYAVSGGDMMEEGDGEYDSYEQALSAGIAAALELIEKKGE
ncbi:hypothetical protein [uncultured Duncaniella sp.]|uniref:hypothetical protein n=1 Tax=uncultured Duncaniella sp. TaxID=2768039 RepID=UPI0025A94D3F|nr:hypothetical protein [uncultured Duncaniella sp.]